MLEAGREGSQLCTLQTQPLEPGGDPSPLPPPPQPLRMLRLKGKSPPPPFSHLGLVGRNLYPCLYPPPSTLDLSPSIILFSSSLLECSCRLCQVQLRLLASFILEEKVLACFPLT